MTAWVADTRIFNFTLTFDATPSNNVQIAFGRGWRNNRGG